MKRGAVRVQSHQPPASGTNKGSLRKRRNKKAEVCVVLEGACRCVALEGVFFFSGMCGLEVCVGSEVFWCVYPSSTHSQLLDERGVCIDREGNRATSHSQRHYNQGTIHSLPPSLSHSPPLTLTLSYQITCLVS